MNNRSPKKRNLLPKPREEDIPEENQMRLTVVQRANPKKKTSKRKKQRTKKKKRKGKGEAP